MRNHLRQPVLGRLAVLALVPGPELPAEMAPEAALDRPTPVQAGGLRAA